MGKNYDDNEGGRFKDILKGVIFAVGGGILVLAGVGVIEILPVAIVLWVLGVPLLINGARIIIKYVKLNMSTKGSSRSSRSSSYSDSPSPSSPRRYRHPRPEPEYQPDYDDSNDYGSDSEVTRVDVYDAVSNLSYGQVKVIFVRVNKTGRNEFDVDLTLEASGNSNSDKVQAQAQALMDQAQTILEAMDVSGNLNAHFN